jgi:uncharacterized protein involved in exopolysaccharide biosynthesis
MDNSEAEAPDGAPQVHTDQGEQQGEAQRAADALKDQIAALRARVKDAQAALRGDQRRHKEPRSFKP